MSDDCIINDKAVTSELIIVVSKQNNELTRGCLIMSGCDAVTVVRSITKIHIYDYMCTYIHT